MMAGNSSVQPVAVTGVVDDEFAPLRDVLARLVAIQGRGGAALCIYRDGRPVVDLVAGEVAVDGVQLLYSVTKAVTAIVLAEAEEHGVFDPDEPLAEHWPEFTRVSTLGVTTRMVLTHRSGVASLDRRLSFEELLAGVADEAVAAQEPYWEPDTDHGYHSFTFGPLVDGILRRTLGRDTSELLRPIAAEFGLDLWIGAPAGLDARIAPTILDVPRRTPARAAWAERSGIPAGTTSRLAAERDLFNDPRFLALRLPSTTGIGDARSLARLFAATIGEVDGRRLLSGAALGRMTRLRSAGTDRVLGFRTRFGSGVQRPFPAFPMLGPSSFGHEAAGGSVAFADPDSGLAVGFTTNVHPAVPGAHPTFLALLPSIRECLETVSD